MKGQQAVAGRWVAEGAITGNCQSNQVRELQLCKRVIAVIRTTNQLSANYAINYDLN